MAAVATNDFAARLGAFQAQDDQRMQWLRFRREYYARRDGGQGAARDLQAALRQYIGQTMPELSGLPIVLKAFANADGLADTLVRTKMTRSWRDLWDFAMSFSQACETFDFVLVGSGKDRADEKIKELLRLFHKNPTCRHVIFGACHDNGYVRELEKRFPSPEARDRLTLLESFQVGREYRSLGVSKTVRMESIFRTDFVSGPVSPLLSSSTTAISRSPTASSGGVSSEGHATHQASTWARAAAPSPSDEGAAQHGGTGHTLLSTATARRFLDLESGAILVNAQGQRVDAELPALAPGAAASWNRKTNEGGMRFCRTFQLSGRCANKVACGYSHATLPEGERMVYRSMMRRQKCHVGPGCRDRTCCYGHHCSCEGTKCKFPGAQHRIDVSSAVRYTAAT
ncbi:conserved hypothetical protein [Verticillium alfalfae VaMs.102]|uniref:C3H1-type domain-containing protein n=1 Tax=Verticillium alfalfae (strain VaMs.102 / ATCC MYA-4576 / FGSC 10136) TaxID=526221 RepID=C9SVM4_VERA1|nr:conserved hypothetical protein [Verticillium alfalfae VaMs.102]EEY22839.1 conserved hypothetical protein [Verticillium alfalfae VaMs.102]